MDNIKIIAS